MLVDNQFQDANVISKVVRIWRVAVKGRIDNGVLDLVSTWQLANDRTPYLNQVAVLPNKINGKPLSMQIMDINSCNRNLNAAKTDVEQITAKFTLNGADNNRPLTYHFLLSAAMASHRRLNRENGGESKNEDFMDDMMFGLCVGLFTAVLLMAVITVLAIIYHRRRRHLPVQFVSNGDSIRLQLFPLEKSVVESFPVFVYPWENYYKDGGLECAVCLREFEDNEKGRVLPLCKHSFHVDCIDAWFQSQSTCPLSRTPGRPAQTHHPS